MKNELKFPIEVKDEVYFDHKIGIIHTYLKHDLSSYFMAINPDYIVIAGGIQFEVDSLL